MRVEAAGRFEFGGRFISMRSGSIGVIRLFGNTIREPIRAGGAILRALVETVVRNLARRTAASAAALVVAVGAMVGMSASCQADLEQKKGFLGEFCNGGDDQCRRGLVCEEGVCESFNNAREVCETVCGKYSECELGIENCPASCLETLGEWSEQRTSQYETCHEEVQCSELQGREAPWNVCFNRLPEAPEDRLAVCDNLEDVSNQCLSQVGIDPAGRVQNLVSECQTEARTIPEDRWGENSSCAEQDNCATLFRCVNEQFELDGEDELPTSPPDG